MESKYRRLDLIPPAGFAKSHEYHGLQLCERSIEAIDAGHRFGGAVAVANGWHLSGRHPKRKRSSSNHPFSGSKMLVSQKMPIFLVTTTGKGGNPRTQRTNCWFVLAIRCLFRHTCVESRTWIEEETISQNCWLGPVHSGWYESLWQGKEIVDSKRSWFRPSKQEERTPRAIKTYLYPPRNKGW